MEVLIPNNPIEVNLATSDDSLLQLYHERWGHQDKRHVKSLLNHELNIHVNIQDELCEACIYEKAHRLNFGSRNNCSSPGELIFADVCGPFDKSFRRFQYFVIFKDQFTKFRCVFFLKQKSDVASALQEFLAYGILGHIVKEVISDNGGEFDNKEVRMVLKKKGVVQRFTAPYTSEQNGGSERENRTIVEMARTLKNSNPDVEFPPALWAELINTSVYILNRTGKSSVKKASPYELWTGKKPRIKHLRIIGSVCYAHIPKQRRRKMDNKATKAFLIGYDGDEKYRLWVQESNTVICSRDVRFSEKISTCGKVIHFPITDENRMTSESEDQGKLEEKTDEGSGNESVEEYTSVDSNSESNFRKLRDRESLRKPKCYEDYIMVAEAFIADFEEPMTFEEAIGCKQNRHWKCAMDVEMSSLIENETWTLEELPKNSKAIPCKWVYKIKKNPDGSIDKYKARLVAKGFTQRYGIDYEQTYRPVTKMATVRSILSIAANERMDLTQFDVCSALLYGKLDEAIYMQ
ncbi:Retrovirus-related Pol polyprotein from transposon TNT 1-94 [Araneus ventricosus]|uniref:Retrovirus-related Pol polyprotein from transposon TNT 1-94 n=1 Tax=Araneus ventricosus TaxID=182803 RepID=A0A4Y2W0B6_ARAVE|nr:Retrovirus-related Pol polyprotein from transposon TNT 1-94 [Araneus ventricosus]